MFTKNQSEYLESLIALIVEQGGLNGRTMEEAIRDAHESRQALLLELAAGETDRAKTVQRAMSDIVWERAQARC